MSIKWYQIDPVAFWHVGGATEKGLLGIMDDFMGSGTASIMVQNQQLKGKCESCWPSQSVIQPE